MDHVSVELMQGSTMPVGANMHIEVVQMTVLGYSTKPVESLLGIAHDDPLVTLVLQRRSAEHVLGFSMSQPDTCA